MTQIPADRFSREMGITQKAFLLTLPSAIRSLPYRVHGREIAISHPQGSVRILLHETGARKIASIELPVTRVEFEFRGLDGQARADFMARFDLCFHRGGG